jgi:hypothetical protein
MILKRETIFLNEKGCFWVKWAFKLAMLQNLHPCTIFPIKMSPVRINLPKLRLAVSLSLHLIANQS